jgi:hypothetical protein
MKPVTATTTTEKIGRGFATLVIVACLGLQTVAIINEVAPFENPKVLWPFLNYPMFKRVHGKDEPVNQYVLLGIRADASEVELRANSSGLSFENWRGLLAAMRRGDSSRLKLYAGLIRQSEGPALVGLRLENHPLLPGKHGPIALPSSVVSTAGLDAGEPLWSAGP